MPAVGFETWYKKECPTVFRVQNVAKGNKRIRLFKYPIVNGGIRDLMEIPYVSEADIRHSLLKGELYIKIVAKEIIVVESNIDLLQFDPCHRQFLIDAGVTNGIDAADSIDTGTGGGGLAEVPYLIREGVELVGPKNSANRNFMIPGGEKFLNGTFEDSEFSINVFHNGRRLVQNSEFIIVESGGAGTGYDTIRIISFVPPPRSVIVANYTVENV